MDTRELVSKTRGASEDMTREWGQWDTAGAAERDARGAARDPGRRREMCRYRGVPDCRCHGPRVCV